MEMRPTLRESLWALADRVPLTDPEWQEGICHVTTHLKRQTNKQMKKIPKTLFSTSSAHKDKRIAELYSELVSE